MYNKLIEELRNNGLHVDNIAVGGREFTRFKDGDGDEKKSGYYKVFHGTTKKGQDFYTIIYGSWKSGVHGTYCTLDKSKMDREEITALNEKIQLVKKENEDEQKRKAEQAESLAVNRFKTLKDEIIPNAYMNRKRISKLYGARIDGENLVIPMRDVDGKIKNLETIFGDGKIKKGLYGGQRVGLFHQVGELGDVVYIAEGFSTGVAIHEAIGAGIIVTFNAGNILPVAKELIKKYPNKRFIVCGDNDQFPNKLGVIDNVGKKKAEEAASFLGGKFVVPEFKEKDIETRPTDFNDLMMLYGDEEVRKQIEAIRPQEVVLTIDENYIVNTPYPDEAPRGKVRPGTMNNIEELIRRLKVAVRYNVISKEEEILIPGQSYTVDNQANAKLAHIISWCERVKIPTTNLGSYLTAMADRNLYNPVATWITFKPWDATSRLEEFFATIDTRKDVEELKKTMIRAWMISAVAAAFEPNGVSAAGVLVLQGEQYVGKTKWFKSLAPASLGVLADGVLLRPDDKDSVYQTVSKWIVELGELDATFKKSDIAQLKAFITKQHDTIRRPYAKKESNFARRTIFFGSVNETDFLKDPTGNRRFWTIPCESIDYNHTIDMQQVWAEFYELYKNGESWYLSHEDIKKLNTHNEEFKQIEPIEEAIRARFNWGNPATTAMTATEVCQRIGINRPTTSECRIAGRILKSLTGQNFRKSNGNKVYDIPVKDSDPDQVIEIT